MKIVLGLETSWIKTTGKSGLENLGGPGRDDFRSFWTRRLW